MITHVCVCVCVCVRARVCVCVRGNIVVGNLVSVTEKYEEIYCR